MEPHDRPYASPSFVNIFVLLLFAAVIAFASSVGTYIYMSSRQSEETMTNQPLVVSPPQTAIQPTSSQFSTQVLLPTQISTQQTGFIEGSLGYPSSGIPEYMEICAEDVNTKQLYCTKEHIKNDTYIYGVGYRLEVPTGSYFVFARVESFSSTYKAYYSDFVTCGFSVNCPSHTPIGVTILTDQTTKNIDPQDWYDVNQKQ